MGEIVGGKAKTGTLNHCMFLDPELSLGLQYQKRGPKRKMFSNEPCRVCGEPATGFNYRVVSCNACKGNG